jgi:hypothetical protein
MHGDTWMEQLVCPENEIESETQPGSEICSSNSSAFDEDELVQEADSGSHEDFQATFVGFWGRATISANRLTWNVGEEVEISVLSSTSFRMFYYGWDEKKRVYVGKFYMAELGEDGRLHWDDGDVWVKGQADFEGKWAAATIRENILMWNEGEEVPISVLSRSSLQMVYIGKVYIAEIRDDCALHWDDGDVWHRARSSAGTSTRCADPCKADDQKVRRTTTRDSTCQLDAKLAQHPPAIAHANSHQNQSRIGNDQASDSTRFTKVSSASAADVCGSTEKAAKVAVVLTPTNATVYKGVVKKFRGSYGWLACEAVAVDYPDCEGILVHKNDCRFKPRQGDHVCFRLAINDQGGPQAVKVTDLASNQQRNSQPAKAVPITAPGTNLVINARDWFNASASERSRMRSK